MTYQDFLNKLSNPAKNGLLNESIDDFDKLSALTEKELLSFHGIGSKSLPIVRDCLAQKGLKLKA